jgi:hypothetical protein
VARDVPTDEEILDAVKREFLDGIRDSIFPCTVSSFDELQDFTDANMIANDLTTRRSEMTGEKWADFFPSIQDGFTAWLGPQGSGKVVFQHVNTSSTGRLKLRACHRQALAMLV